MGTRIAFLFPGQGSQYMGMGKDFYDAYPVAKEVFEEADAILGYNFSDIIFHGPKEELTLTKNSQLAIFITSYAIFRVVKEEFPTLVPSVCAGLSLGEYTALVAANKITFKDCLVLVKNRAQFMNDACQTHPGSMSVVLGMAENQVLEAIHGFKEVGIANLNCPGQIVIAGTKEALEKASAELRLKGAKRILPLDVSGAFHSDLMTAAQNSLTPFLQSVPMNTSPTRLVMNTLGDYVDDLSDIRAQLIQQVTKPVRWEKGIQSMVASGIDLFIEMGCGKTLAGMNKRIGITAPTLSIEKVEDLQVLAKDLDV
ncbi:MAG: [acyl-carrier-protein] S-malonyltransferase [Chlamydiae bacterium]|nr:[acyl-carrier-protein] S-malonyltransferase [Chlamydiota bacterium]